MTETLHYSGTLVVVTCWCGTKHAVPEDLRKYQLREHENGRDHFIYCPLGHQYAPAGESEASKLRRQLERKEQQLTRERAAADQEQARLREQRDTAESRRRAEKAAKTKIKNRVARGICPCCNRGFANLGQHMQSQHPEFAIPEAD